MRCRDCARVHSQARYRKSKKRKKVKVYLRFKDRHRVIKSVKQKLCTKCGKWKKEIEYYKSSSEKDGLMSRCKKCTYKPAKKSRKSRSVVKNWNHQNHEAKRRILRLPRFARNDNTQNTEHMRPLWLTIVYWLLTIVIDYFLCFFVFLVPRGEIFQMPARFLDFASLRSEWQTQYEICRIQKPEFRIQFRSLYPACEKSEILISKSETILKSQF